MSRTPLSAPTRLTGANQKVERQQMFARRRLEAVAGLLALGMVMLVIRAVDLQVVQSENLTNLAEKQRYREFTAIAPRGTISDSRGRILAESVEIPSIAAMADEVPADRIPDLAKALGQPEKAIRHRLKNRKGFVWLARQVRPALAEAVVKLDIPGVRQETEWRRYQPLGPETGHLLGFVGIDGNGLEGVERVFNDQLQGEAGIRQVRRDARGHSLPGGIWLRNPVAGKAISLNLDASIQSIAYAALADGVRKQHAKGGSVVVMRPQDGAVLAMASWPGYNPNNFGDFHPSQWRNRAITDVFEPGSTLKPFTVAAALMSGRWQADSKIFCENGAMKVADYVIHDDHSEGWLDMSGLLAKSSNIGAAKLALDIGNTPLFNMLRDVGFGHRSQIGLTGESPGIVLPMERWGPVETANIAFGQGIAVTPLQLATAFSVLANGGIYTQPQLIRRQSEAAAEAGSSHRIMPAAIAGQVLKMLEYATSDEGTGGNAVPTGYRVAGKTGTAQKANKSGGYSDRFTAVFAGIAPVNNPMLVIAVVVDEPEKSIYGAQAAAPIFRNIAANVLPYLGVTAQIEDDQAWKAIRIADSTASVTPGKDAMGMSLREVRHLAAQMGLRLKVHGSGWVGRQSPATLVALNPGDSLEVWLHD